jgi:hypothetical protein
VPKKKPNASLIRNNHHILVTPQKLEPVRGKLGFRVATDRSIKKIVNWQLCVPESRFIEMLIARTTVGASQNRQGFRKNRASFFASDTATA